MDSEHEMTVSRGKLYAARIEYERLVDGTQQHVHLRVSADGEPRVDVDAGYCISPDEYNRRMPHTVTLLHQVGSGTCVLPEGWDDPDGELYDCIDDLVNQLENEGYTVFLER